MKFTRVSSPRRNNATYEFETDHALCYQSLAKSDADSRPEPIILLNLPIILFQISHKLSLLFFQDGPIILILFSKHGHACHVHALNIDN